jgi:glycine cleavage system H protein
MVALMILAMFIIFIAVDYIFHRRWTQPQPLVATSRDSVEFPFPLSIVGGFKLPAHLAYHPGHTWAMKETGHVVRIGLDDFAARLVGQFEQIELPVRGRWLRQGEPAWTLKRGSHRFEMLSPIEGEVVDVNQDALKDPSTAQLDPYGAGWLVAVNSPAVDANLKNLLRGRLAQRWMEESVGTLQSRLNPGGGAHMQDGGRALPDLLSQVSEERWEEIAGEFFLA